MPDMNEAASLIYNNSDHTPAAAAPKATPAAPSSDESIARQIYPGRAKCEDVFDKDARERREAKQAQERGEAQSRSDEIRDAVKDALKDQKPAQSQQQPKTPDQVKTEAAQLVSDLKLDASDPMAGEFSTVAAELGLGKDGAAKLVDMHQRYGAQLWERQSEQWAAASQKEFSPADIDNARLVTRFADDEARELLNGPYGNHPALVRMLSKAGAALRKAGIA